MYQEQNYKFDNAAVQNDLSEFLLERLKYYMKDKEIRSDIINASLNNKNILIEIFENQSVINANISLNDSKIYFDFKKFKKKNECNIKNWRNFTSFNGIFNYYRST